MCSNENTPTIMVFRPNWDEFQNFSSYIDKMESMGAHKAGLAKVIPPSEWIARKKSYDEDDIMEMKIPKPIYQIVQGDQGVYQQERKVKKSMSVKQFKKISESKKYRTPYHNDYMELETVYWDQINSHSPIYGADVIGSVTDKDVKGWNMNKLETILDIVNEDGTIIEGVNTPYLYFGMWKTTFAWHTEDMDLYSINYVHVGFPKTWYAIPPEHGHCFEKLVNQLYPTQTSICPAFLRHKMAVISPDMLHKNSIPVNTITQEPGEFMITFPFSYHSGFNHGYNIAEAINFASPRWVDYGKTTKHCICFNNPTINMDKFVERIQSDRYQSWKDGTDIGTHPENCTGPAKKRKLSDSVDDNDTDKK